MNELQQGGNAPLTGDSVTVTVDWTAPSGCEVDVSAYLLTETGKVRGDQDMVFYNQNSGGDGAVRYTPGSSPKGSFDVDLTRLPPAIQRIVFCVTIDQAAARRQTLAMVSGARIAVAPRGQAPSVGYVPQLGGASEAAMTFGELYLRNGQWKFRAVGQGFNGGLGPLARSFGIDVADESAGATGSAAAPAAPKIDLHKAKVEQRLVNLEKQDKKLVSLAKAAGVSLAKQKGADRPAKVWLILDVSGSMRGLFKSGAVDRLAQRALAYGLNLDDDGEIGVILFDHRATMFGNVNAGNYKTFAQDIQKRKDVWGTTDYGKAMQMLRETAAGEGDFGRTPVYVIFVTDGGTENRKLAEQQIKDASSEGIFWKFMAIGPMPSGVKSGSRALPRGFDFLAYLDDMPGRVIDNADFFAVDDPDGPSDVEFFDLMSTEYGGWLEAAAKAGVLRG